KKDLYVYLIEYSVQIIELIVEQIDLNETDIFKRIENIGLKKLHTQQKFPQVFDFLVSTKQEESAEVKEIIKQKVEPIYDKSKKKKVKLMKKKRKKKSMKKMVTQSSVKE